MYYHIAFLGNVSQSTKVQRSVISCPPILVATNRYVLCLCFCLTLCLDVCREENSAISRSIIHPRVTQSSTMFQLSKKQTVVCGNEFSTFLKCEYYCTEWVGTGNKRMYVYLVYAWKHTCMRDRVVVSCCCVCQYRVISAWQLRRREKYRIEIRANSLKGVYLSGCAGKPA